MILVTGATGQLGQVVIRHLTKNSSARAVAGFVRDISKSASLQTLGVDIRQGDYEDAASLEAAMAGVKRVLLIASNDEQNRMRQHQNVIDAAKQAQVEHISYTSRCLRDPGSLSNALMQDHFKTEELIRASGLDYSIFRNILYMDAIPQFVGPRVLESGIRLPVGDSKISFATRDDMGEAIATALLQDTMKSTYNLTGSRQCTFSDVAQALSQITNKAISFHNIEMSQFEAGLASRGMSVQMMSKITGFLKDIVNGQESEVFDDLSTLLQREPTSLVEGLRSMYS